MRIYIDFDGTLFDTDKYENDFIKIYNKYGINKNIFNKVSKRLFNNINLFDIEIITNYFIKNYNIDSKISKEIESLYNKDYIYKDVIPCLRKIKKLGYSLSILTYGNKSFQSKKIDSSNISIYFDEIIITDSSKSKLNIDYKNSVFVDNNPKDIIDLYNINPKKIIRIKRSTDKYIAINLENSNIIECSDFYQITELLKGNN